jgi:rhodanese-related sulfurtransferase
MMYKIRYSTIFSVLLLLTLSATLCVGQVQSRAYRAMLKTLLSHSVPETTVQKAVAEPQAIFLDAREPKEYAVSHLTNAIFVGYDHADLQPIAQLPKNQRIIVYCSVGYRSEKITEQLIAAGYTNVSNLYGGIFEWVNTGNVVVDNQNQPTDKVHAYDRTWGIWLKKGKKVY